MHKLKALLIKIEPNNVVEHLDINQVNVLLNSKASKELVELSTVKAYYSDPVNADNNPLVNEALSQVHMFASTVQIDNVGTLIIYGQLV